MDGQHAARNLGQIGIAYETVIRTLSQFKAEGLVMAKGRRITIYDKAQLEAVYN